MIQSHKKKTLHWWLLDLCVDLEEMSPGKLSAPKRSAWDTVQLWL